MKMAAMAGVEEGAVAATMISLIQREQGLLLPDNVLPWV